MCFTGVFPVHDIDIEIATADETYVSVADMESMSLSIDTGVETWNSISEDGWQRSLATAKSFTASFSGKRNIGDAGNDYVASKALANGRDCDSVIRLTFPDGSKFTAPVVIQVKEFMGGDATNVAPLNFDCISNGKPTYEKTA
jgi:predicted secreted protein